MTSFDSSLGQAHKNALSGRCEARCLLKPSVETCAFPHSWSLPAFSLNYPALNSTGIPSIEYQSR